MWGASYLGVLISGYVFVKQRTRRVSLHAILSVLTQWGASLVIKLKGGGVGPGSPVSVAKYPERLQQATVRVAAKSLAGISLCRLDKP